MQAPFDLTQVRLAMSRISTNTRCPACGRTTVPSNSVVIHGDRFHRSCVTYSRRSKAAV
jgi:hypothetical protein